MNAIGAKWKRITKQWDCKTRHLYSRVDLLSSRRIPDMWIPALENAGNWPAKDKEIAFEGCTLSTPALVPYRFDTVISNKSLI